MRILFLTVLLSSCYCKKNAEVTEIKQLTLNDIIDIEIKTINHQCSDYDYKYLIPVHRKHQPPNNLNSFFEINEKDTLLIIHTLNDPDYNRMYFNKNNKTIYIIQNVKGEFVFNYQLDKDVKLCFLNKSGDDEYCDAEGVICIITKIFMRRNKICYLSSYFCTEIFTELFPDFLNDLR